MNPDNPETLGAVVSQESVSATGHGTDEEALAHALDILSSARSRRPSGQSWGFFEDWLYEDFPIGRFYWFDTEMDAWVALLQLYPSWVADEWFIENAEYGDRDEEEVGSCIDGLKRLPLHEPDRWHRLLTVNEALVTLAPDCAEVAWVGAAAELTFGMGEFEQAIRAEYWQDKLDGEVRYSGATADIDSAIQHNDFDPEWPEVFVRPIDGDEIVDFFAFLHQAFSKPADS